MDAVRPGGGGPAESWTCGGRFRPGPASGADCGTRRGETDTPCAGLCPPPGAETGVGVLRAPLADWILLLLARSRSLSRCCCAARLECETVGETRDGGWRPGMGAVAGEGIIPLREPTDLLDTTGESVARDSLVIGGCCCCVG
jgi:hypothetical protein